jgi:hypothetical protein
MSMPPHIERVRALAAAPPAAAVPPGLREYAAFATMAL